MEVFMGRGLKNAIESLSKTLAPRAHRDGINVLERADRTILVEECVPPVGWLSANLYCLGHQLLNAVDEGRRIKGCRVWLRQVDDLMLQAIHDKVPVLKFTDNDRRIQQQLYGGCRKCFWILSWLEARCTRPTIRKIKRHARRR